jgi:long-chain-fatty-acid--CoA ligase ACSBG
MPEAINFFKNELKENIKTTDEALTNPKVSEYIKKCIELNNKQSVSRAAHIRKFKLLPDDFSIPGGELTPTMKLKRKVTENKYKEFVDEMFAPEAKL